MEFAPYGHSGSKESPDFKSALPCISVTETFENGKQARFLLKHVHVKTVT